ncbi:MAG: efflux RND transporter periplasmic adaptor subunit [Blastocatellia bacterium]|nr:efflux RND transporter periplasmic adaptor subunit [Blastocatellia bacterium]
MSSPSNTRKRIIWTGLVTALILQGFFVVRYLQPQFAVAETPEAVQPTTSTSGAVSALGRFEPTHKVIKLAPPTGNEVARIEKLFVEEGDYVKAGQVIAVLDSQSRSRAALLEAQKQVLTAQARLAKVEAGAKRADLTAQEAECARIETRLAQARIDLGRYQSLHKDGIVSKFDLDQRQLEVDTLQRELARAQSTLTSIGEVRPVDVSVSKAEIAAGEAAVAKANEQLETAYVRASASGRVLKIHTRAGETVSSKGILEIGETDRMYVVAEVFESDIKRVKIGQRAQISARALGEILNGTVEQTGLLIGKRDILDADPVADVDARVIEVRIRLDEADSKRVEGLTNMRVDVRIEK